MRVLARLLSIAGHPFVTLLAFAVAAGARAGAARAAALVALAVIAPVAALVAWKRGTRAWETVDASDPRDRPALYAVVAAAGALALAAALLAGRGAGPARGLVAVLLVFAVAAAVNRRVKASLHVACASFGAAALLPSGAPAGWALAVLALPLGWARVRLGRHVPGEVAAGAAIGAAVGLLFALG